MKKIILLGAMAALIIAGSLAAAKPEFMVKCCTKGKCQTMARPACQQLGGHIVNDCRQCR